MSETSKVVEKRVGEYIAIRSKIDEIKKRHEEELKEFVETQNLLSAWLTAHLDKEGAQSIKTSKGTVYASTRWTASLEDPKAFMDYVIGNNAFDLLDRRANGTAVRAFVEEHKHLPPGAQLSALRSIGVRRASEK